MKKLIINSVPDELVESLDRLAAKNFRSRSGEVLSILSAAAGVECQDDATPVVGVTEGGQ